MTRQCVLSEEDSVSQKDDVTVSGSPTHHFYDLVCLDNREYYLDILSLFLIFRFLCNTNGTEINVFIVLKTHMKPTTFKFYVSTLAK